MRREKKNGYAPPSLAIPDMAVWNETIEYVQCTTPKKKRKSALEACK